MNKKFKCVAYCRVSKKSRKQTNSRNQERGIEPSIEKQQEQINAFFKNHSDNYELIDIFSDVGSGATLKGKDGLKQALDFINEGRNGCNALVVYMKDRIGRNANNYIDIIRSVGNEGKYIFSIENGPEADPICVTHNANGEKQTPENFIINVVRDSIDAYAYENYLTRLSKNAINFNKQRINNGEIYLSGTVRLGYKYVKDDSRRKGHFEIVEEEAKLVRMIYDLYANQGYGYHKIVLYMNNNHYFSRNRKGDPVEFNIDSVSSVLSFDGYGTGEAKFFSRENVLRRKQTANEFYVKFGKKYDNKQDIPQDELTEFLEEHNEEEIIIPNAYPIIIDHDTYEKAKDRRESYTKEIRKPESKTDCGWLSGLLYCECGAKMHSKGRRYKTYTATNPKTGEKEQHKTFNAYVCSRYKKNNLDGRGDKCTAQVHTLSYKYDFVIVKLVEYILNMTSIEEKVNEACTADILSSLSKASDDHNEKQRLKEALIRNNKDLIAISEERANGVFDNEEANEFGLPTIKDYEKRVKVLKEQRSDIKSKLELLNKTKEDKMKLYQTYLDKINGFKTSPFKKIEKEDPYEFIHMFVKRIDFKVRDDHLYEFTVHLKLKDDEHEKIPSFVATAKPSNKSSYEFALGYNKELEDGTVEYVSLPNENYVKSIMEEERLKKA